MERIKQALDKARAERDAAGVQSFLEVGAPAVTARSRSATPIKETAIAYSQTIVCEPHLPTLHAHRIIAGETNPDSLTAYKMLRTQVLQRMTAHGWNTLAVTSPVPGDGKTLTAINLAISLARELHHTVLLVDMDLRNPSIHRCFGLRPDKGIGDFLLHGEPLESMLVNPGINRLVILPGRDPVYNSSEILASPAMGSLVRELKSRYPTRMVVFDLPPVLSADDALAFAPFADAFLLVLRDGKTTKDEVQHAMELLKDATILGSVLNASDDKISAYY